MDFRILGPLEAREAGRDFTPRGSKQRALLALLLVHANETLSTSRLIDELWGDDPPATAAKTVQVHISQLRKALNGSGLIVTRGHGYQFELPPEQLDAYRFERLLAEGSGELGAGKPQVAIALLEQALALWRGPPLADVAGEPFADGEIARLEDLRAAALEQLIEAKLELGRHAEVVPRLEALIREHPYRERLRAHLMLALYRSERQADALQAYQDARNTLVGDLGIEPGERLRELEHAILTQDPALAIPAAQTRDLPPELATETLLVGRDEELEWLRRHWQQARQGAGRLVLVVGERGMGKTRLAAEIAMVARGEGADVLYGELDGVRGPAVVVLDDVDRADDVPAASVAGLPVLVVATAEDASLAERLGAAATLQLAPLDSESVAAVARLYTGSRAEPPAEELLAASGGVPRRVHRTASDWARAAAARRVGATANRVASERVGLRVAEDDLEGDVVALQAVRDRAVPEDAIVACPFKGLAVFDVDDAPVFFGRERLVAEMVARLAGAPLIGVVGASGSGKSSALRAGLIASLRGGVLPGSERWGTVLLRPGMHPLRALEIATADLPAHETVVVAVDQFEELFTACPDEEERAEFVRALLALTHRTRPRTLVLLAMRADFYGRCAAYPQLSRLLGAGHVLVGPMRRDGLRRAIELPAVRAGLQVEPALVDTLLDDVEGEPGGLPLLSTTLLELWENRDGRRLTLGAYREAGGVRGAVARLAEGAYGRLDPERREIARRILLRLAGERENDAVVRRRVSLDELEADRDGEVAEVLGELARDRLVTIGNGEVEVAHEALLREWPRLRAWLDDDAEGRRQHRHLIGAARDWDASGRDASELYRGGRLAATLDWVGEHGDELNSVEREFIDASRAAADAAAARQRGTNRRLRVLLAGVAGLLVLAVVAGVVALSQRSDARDAALTADAQRLGAQALTDDRLDRAALLALAGVHLDDSPPTRSSLLAVLLRKPAALGELRGDGWPLYSVAASPDGRLVAMGDERGGVIVYDAITRQRVGRPYTVQAGLIQHMNFSPDGRTLALSVHSDAGATTVDLIDPRSGVRKRRFRLPAFPGSPPYVLAPMVFQTNGRDLVVEETDIAFPGGPASMLWRLSAVTGAVEKRPLRVGRHSAWSLATTSDRRRLVVTSPGDERTYEIDPETLRVRRSWPVGDYAGAVTADGRAFALASERGAVRLLDLRSGKVRRFDGAGGPEPRIAFAGNGTLAGVDQKGGVTVWDVAGGTIRERFSAHDREAPALAASPDGRTLYTVSNDARMLIWDLAGNRRLDRRFDAGPRLDVIDTPKGLAISPDGRTLAVTQTDGSVDLLDARTLVPRARLHAQRAPALAVDFSPDGRLLAVTGNGGRVTLWNARDLSPAGQFHGTGGYSQALAFSPDGRLLAGGAGGSDVSREVRVWDVRNRRPTRARFASAAPSVAFSPDARLVAAAGFEQPTEVHDARTGRLVARLRTPDFGRSVAFSPDGRLLATGYYGGSGQLWSTGDWKPVGRRFAGHTARLTALEFSPDGRTLATGSADGTVLLWDIATQTPIGSPLRVEADAFVAATFAPDGSHLFAVPSGGRGVSWDVRPEAWKQHACLVAGRPLTRREWRDALPERPYRPICP